jgi:hypothetical protein
LETHDHWLLSLLDGRRGRFAALNIATGKVIG